MKGLTPVDLLALVLIVVGGLNWGLVGAFDFNLVDTLFGEMSLLSRVVYLLVGASAIYTGAMLAKFGRRAAVA
jgi:uncharacterized protein